MHAYSNEWRQAIGREVQIILTVVTTFSRICSRYQSNLFRMGVTIKSTTYRTLTHRIALARAHYDTVHLEPIDVLFTIPLLLRVAFAHLVLNGLQCYGNKKNMDQTRSVPESLTFSCKAHVHLISLFVGH